MATRVRIFFLDNGVTRLFVKREKQGGPIQSVLEIRNADTSSEVKIPLDKIKDEDSLTSYIEAMKGSRGIEG